MSETKPSVKPSDRPVRALVPQPHGGALLPGAGGGNNGGGRPPDEFKAAMAQLASSDEVLGHVRTVLNDPNHPQFLGAWKWVTERGYGKMPDIVTGPDNGPVAMAVEIIVTRRLTDGEG